MGRREIYMGIIFVSFVISNPGFSQSLIRLPKPILDGGKPLMQVLQNRQTTRTFAKKKLPDHLVANLLWAAFGINRENGKRTAPSAMNWQEISIYVAMPNGLYLWDPEKNVLNRILEEDIRKQAGKQDFTQTAPIDLIYVADYSKMKGVSEAEKKVYAYCDTGFISQNVYLFCASEGLSTVVIGMVDRAELEKTMKLDKNKKVILVQPVGFPKP